MRAPKLLLKAGSIPESTLLDSQSQLATDELKRSDRAKPGYHRPPGAAAAAQPGPRPRPRASRLEVPDLPDPDQASCPGTDRRERACFSRPPATRPEIKAADLRVLSARRSVDIARGGYYPRLIFATGSLSTGLLLVAVRPAVSPATHTEARYLPVLQRRARRAALCRSNFVIPTGRQPSFETLPYALFRPAEPTTCGESMQFALQHSDSQRLAGAHGRAARLINAAGRRCARRAGPPHTCARASSRPTPTLAPPSCQYAAASRQVAALTLTQRNAEIRFNNGLLSGTEFNIAKNNLNFADLQPCCRPSTASSSGARWWTFTKASR
ncbi:MAG: hypothetical protein WKG07_04745 [Hymenobacter sp.]